MPNTIIQSGHNRKNFVTPELSELVDKVFAKESLEQRKIVETSRKENLPPIHIGPGEGRFLEFLVKAIQGKKGLELGTLGGYSTSWLLRGAGSGGKVISIEADPHHAQIAQKNLELFLKIENPGAQFEIIQGKALQVLPTLSEIFDFVFIDAQKAEYGSYVAWAVEHTRVGGLIICDNAFLGGCMSQFGLNPKEFKPPTETHYTRTQFEGMSQAWQLLSSSPSLCSWIAPTGEGMGIALKISG